MLAKTIRQLQDTLKFILKLEVDARSMRRVIGIQRQAIGFTVSTFFVILIPPFSLLYCLLLLFDTFPLQEGSLMKPGREYVEQMRFTMIENFKTNLYHVEAEVSTYLLFQISKISVFGQQLIPVIAANMPYYIARIQGCFVPGKRRDISICSHDTTGTVNHQRQP